MICRELEPKAAAALQQVLNESDKIKAKSKAKGLWQNPQRQNQLPQVLQVNPTPKPPQKQQKQQKHQAHKAVGNGGIGGGYGKAPSTKAPSMFGKRTELKGPSRKVKTNSLPAPPFFGCILNVMSTPEHREGRGGERRERARERTVLGGASSSLGVMLNASPIVSLVSLRYFYSRGRACCPPRFFRQ